jgi:hypothetical protein
MSKTVRQSGGFVETFYAIAHSGRLVGACTPKKHIVVPGIHEDIRDAEQDAAVWAHRLGKKHRVVAVEVEYKWKVKDNKTKGKT